MDALKGRSPSTILPWDKFSNWVHCVCVVTFDLELGQALEVVYPGHIKLTEREKSNICYLAFPDSNSGCMGNTQFNFRIRQCPDAKRCISQDLINYNKQCPIPLKVDNGHFYGYVYFRQVKDRSIRRGYFQKSVVILTRLPFACLFSHVLRVLAPDYFDNGDPSIEAACHDLDQWDPPEPGATLHLPLMGSLMLVRIPSRLDRISNNSNVAVPESQATGPLQKIISSVHETDYFNYFKPVLSHIHLLWELVLTNEPLVVMAQSPTQCSETVQALVSLVWPLQYCTDYRPFFTIHDSEFREYTTKTQAPPDVLLGVTNPFFAKTLQHWPHIIRVGEEITAAGGKSKLKKTGLLKTVDTNPELRSGLYTQYKPYLSKDKALLKRVAKGMTSQRPTYAQTAILRRYFLELTQSFMIPLERYVASLMPLQKNISPFKGSPNLAPFDPNNFLATLESAGPQLTSRVKGDWLGLYRRFLQCANFNGWYRHRAKEVRQKLHALHLEALADADVAKWVKTKTEVEVVDLCLRLNNNLETAKCNKLELSEDAYERLQHHLDATIKSLPEDLRKCLGSSLGQASPSATAT